MASKKSVPSTFSNEVGNQEHLFYAVIEKKGKPQKSSSNGQLCIFETAKEALEECLENELVIRVRIFKA